MTKKRIYELAYMALLEGSKREKGDLDTSQKDEIVFALRYMTTKRIYVLAYIRTLEIWKEESDFLGNEPDEVQEMRKLLIAAGYRNI